MERTDHICVLGPSDPQELGGVEDVLVLHIRDRGEVSSVRVEAEQPSEEGEQLEVVDGFQKLIC